MDGMLAALGQRAVTHLSLPDRLLPPDALLHRAGGSAAGPAAFDGETSLRLLLPFDNAAPHHRCGMAARLASHGGIGPTPEWGGPDSLASS